MYLEQMPMQSVLEGHDKHPDLGHLLRPDLGAQEHPWGPAAGGERCPWPMMANKQGGHGENSEVKFKI